MIEGYKCFNKGLINRYGKQFKVNEIYHIENEIKFGINGNGFHMCKNLEDTLRYFDAFSDKVDICKVLGYGKTALYEDEYNGFYDMFACEYLKVIKLLERKEIIDYALNLNNDRIKRFISLYKLEKNEIELFMNKYYNNDDILDSIEYYQKNNKNIYKRLLK